MARKSPRSSTPGFGLSLRWRITLPFLLLAFGIGLGAAYLVLRVLQESAADRFLRQLADSGQQAADSVVGLERELLEVERLLANTEGLSEAVIAGDAESLRARALPLALNADVDAVTVVDADGVSLLSARRRVDGEPGSFETVRGEAFYAQWSFVAEVLRVEGGPDEAEKRIGVGAVRQADLEVPVLFIVGPVQTGEPTPAGAILVGIYMQEAAGRLAQSAGANVTVYGLDSRRSLASTLAVDEDRPLNLPQDWASAALADDDEGAPARRIEVGGVPYREVLIPFVGRGGADVLGVLGVSLVDSVSGQTSAAGATPGRETVRLVVGFGALALLLIGAAGLAISQSIAGPLADLAHATQQVAQGNLDVKVPERGGGEFTVLARSFNRMVRGLRTSAHSDGGVLAERLPPAAGDRYDRETEPPPEADSREVALLAFEVRPRRLQSDGGGPELALAMDSALERAVEVIEAHRGQLVQFDGSRGLAAFGLPEDPKPARVRALLATHAACGLADGLTALNIEYKLEDRPGFDFAVAANDGEVVIADIGRKYGLSNPLLGVSVNVVQELLAPARKLESGGILVSAGVRDQLGNARSQFEFGRKGRVNLRSIGREETIYEVRERRIRLGSASEL